MASFTIRQLNEADAAAYRDLRLRALKEDPEPFATTYEETVDRPLAVFAERLRDQGPDGGFTLGAFDGHLIGVVTLIREEAIKMRHRGVLVAMYVAPEARGRRVGHALVSTLIYRAGRIAGLERLYLTVALPNDSARKLYRSCGFVTYGIDERALKLGDRYWDELQMVLHL